MDVRSRRVASHFRRLSGTLVVVSCLWLGACEKKPVVKIETSRPLAVVVSCDTAGWIVPCGCSSKQAGGLLRRATYVQQVQQTADVLVLDAGGAAGGKSAYDESKFEAILKGEVLLQTAAHNIGASELKFGPETLRRLGQEYPHLISSNLQLTDGSEFLPTHRIVTAGNRRAAVAGVISPQLVRGDWQVAEPRTAVLNLIQELQGQYDLLIVLAYLPEDELAALAESLPEVDLVIGGPTLQSVPPKRAGPTVWAAATNKGKFLVHLEQPQPKAAWDGKIVELGPELADDASQRQNLTQFRDLLARTDFSASQTSFAPVLAGDLPANFQVAGTAACQKCHAGDCELWSESKHGLAWQTLVEKKSQMDPYCQHCHTTGYGSPEGFQSLASATTRGNVGCESCHGPAQAHVVDPRVKTLYDARDRCVTCHDHENSPKFNYDSFWNLISHGEPAQQVTQTP